MKIAPSTKRLQMRNYVVILARTDRFCSEITLERFVDCNTVYICIIDKPYTTQVIKDLNQGQCYNSQII
jgi:hypothetical protein